MDQPTEYALTTIHGPDGPTDIVRRGMQVPEHWPEWFRSDLREHGSVSTKQPEVVITVTPPVNRSLMGKAQREHMGKIGRPQ